MSYLINLLPEYCRNYLNRDILARYSVTILSVVVALLLSIVLQSLIKSTAFSVFFAAVTFSAWYGGLGSGLLATILSVLASNFFLTPVLNDNLTLRHEANLLHLILFSIVALLISSLNTSLRIARQRSEANLLKLQLSEERYRRIVDTAYEGIWLLNRKLQTEYVNQRLAEMLRYSVEEMSDCYFENLIVETVENEVQTVLVQWQEGTRQRFDCRFRTQDGSDLWAIVSTTPIVSTQNNFNGVLLMLTDITERKQVEAERTLLLTREQSARAEAEAANCSKDQFLAILSHELRSPLNPILGWAQILRSQKLDPDTSNYALQIIERNAKLQTKLIEDLLDISRIIQNKISLELYPVNLVSTIEAATEIVRFTAEEKAINLLLSIGNLDSGNTDKSLEYLECHSLSHLKTSLEPYYVLGDPKRLQQIVWNLLSNAIKFTPHGGRVEIQLSIVGGKENSNLTQSTQNFAEIKVTDTGIGIQSEFLPYVFEFFRQADNTTTREFGGLGLGLAIVRRLVELHGGTIDAQSMGQGQGASFIVKLPLLQHSDKIEKIKNSKTLPHLSSTPLPLAGLKILVVDDEPDNREMLVFMLEEYGAIVTTAGSAEQALQVLVDSQQDLLISDIGMPNVNGYMLMSQIRASVVEQNRQIPAIALTGYAGELDRKQAESVGFQTSLAKPVELDELLATILRVIS
ncbi:ATP-binding protein [Aetokthonos hydrillicola Thurmond2011]|jgi:PAS domain S-box-containing protein|uniref:histidine kinase n=1 Tax=Aetokthonos hydrillicola Thurmond2011 TaxID=2712845 RepID=A0AAP5IAI8_9CYAN|nr:ATP-binding protein [Aetokthonos hydrillicola]MBO3458394.1 response regulator [Aetokthonos hydrillicola CCALA 1050]MBW4586066.1 response regulator [Aetokthonos hydrillicola CCALA 1050]MDR9897886.1 ATP-binding protein [Aetokthonos hydrillicola Thurmond2011]